MAALEGNVKSGSLLSVTLARMFSICCSFLLAWQSAYFSMLARSLQVHLGRSLCVVRAVEEPEGNGFEIELGESHLECKYRGEKDDSGEF